MELLYAPWTPEQVDALNEFQRLRVMHPFTCGWRSEHPEHEGVLEAREGGWSCPAEGCQYTQNWAHPFMADPEQWPKPFQGRF